MTCIRRGKLEEQWMGQDWCIFKPTIYDLLWYKWLSTDNEEQEMSVLRWLNRDKIL